MPETNRSTESTGHAQLQAPTRGDGEDGGGSGFKGWNVAGIHGARITTDLAAIRGLLERIAFNTAVTQLSFEDYREKVLYGTVHE